MIRKINLHCIVKGINLKSLKNWICFGFSGFVLKLTYSQKFFSQDLCSVVPLSKHDVSIPQDVQRIALCFLHSVNFDYL